jgi:hypothetical protein
MDVTHLKKTDPLRQCIGSQKISINLISSISFFMNE